MGWVNGELTVNSSHHKLNPSVTGLSLWNNLPPSIRNIGTIDEFKSKCKLRLWQEYMEAEVLRLSAGLFV